MPPRMQKTARAIMFQGTGSDVGKSLIVAGLARALSNRGHNVKPFKPQNMSNNAAVTVDGGEIGRAQALQARAARTPPTTNMNPVLLKPQSGHGSQIILCGELYGTARAAEYQTIKPRLLEPILESFNNLKADADVVLIEGAGSASEINLRRNDIANMGFAQAANLPVVLIGDIDRGGVIASLVGTKHVIDPADAALICGFIVNRFRGDPSLFDEGLAFIAKATGWDSFGLVPHFARATQLPDEDAFRLREKSQALDDRKRARNFRNSAARIKIAIPILPHLSNFDDLDPLATEPDIELIRVWPGETLPPDASLIILCGSKSTLADLAVLREAGFAQQIKDHVQRGGHLLGICGGYQMLGNTLNDPAGVEGERGIADGLGLLDVATVLSGEKRLATVIGHSFTGVPLAGYEIHLGRTSGPATSSPFASFDNGRTDGAVCSQGRVCGTHLHGLFGNDQQRADWMARLAQATGSPDIKSRISYNDEIEATLDALADHLETHLDIDSIMQHAR